MNPQQNKPDWVEFALNPIVSIRDLSYSFRDKQNGSFLIPFPYSSFPVKTREITNVFYLTGNAGNPKQRSTVCEDKTYHLVYIDLKILVMKLLLCVLKSELA